MHFKLFGKHAGIVGSFFLQSFTLLKIIVRVS